METERGYRHLPARTRAHLRTHGVASAEALARRAFETPPAPGDPTLPGLAELARTAGLPYEDLLLAVAGDAAGDARRLVYPGRRQRWTDVAALALVALLLVAVLQALGVGRGVERRVAVRPDRMLAPYTPITPDALTLAPGAGSGFTAVEEAVGRYTLRAVPPGATLAPDAVSRARLPSGALRGRVVVSLPLAPLQAGRHPPPPFRAALLFPADEGAPGVVADALVLDVVAEGTTAWAVAAIEPRRLASVRGLGRPAVLATARL